MKIRPLTVAPLLLWLSIIVAIGQQQETVSKKLIFKNGNALSGIITQWTPNKLTITSPHIIEPITFPTSTIAFILNSNQEKLLNQETVTTTTVTLKKHITTPKLPHDSFTGILKEITPTHIKLNTPYAGILNLKRPDIQQVNILHSDEVIYMGPNSLEEWTNTRTKSSSWQYQNNSLVSGKLNGIIAKEVNLPDYAHLHFDVLWYSNPSSFDMNLYSSSLDSQPQSYYRLNFRSSSISFNKINKHGGFTYLKRLNKSPNYFKIIQQMRGDRRSKVDLYLNKQKGYFSVYINNQFYCSFQDPDPQPENYGSAIHLLCQPSSPVTINSLKIFKWNGRLPQATPQTKSEDKILGKGSTITMKNGDTIVGEIGKVQRTTIEVKTNSATINTTLGGIKSIYFDNKKRTTKINTKNNILLWLNDKQVIRVTLLGYSANRLKVFHPSFGEAEFNLDYFKKYELHAL